MKKCTYCGKEYPDNVTICATDQEALKFDSPPPSEEKIRGGFLPWLRLGVSHHTASKIVIAATCLCVVLAIWTYWPVRGGNADEVTNRDFVQCHRALARLTIAQKLLPDFAVRIFHLSERESKIVARFEADRNALIRSGYFIEVPILDSNRTTPQTLSRIQTIFRNAHANCFIEMMTNSTFVLCRPEHRSLCEKVIGND